MPAVSVIICAHNPRPDYLVRVINALKVQTLPTDRWELLLVDNASQKPLASAWDLSWHPNARHLREHEVGKTHALLLAIAEFKGELFVIVDDDNVLGPDYLETALRISADYPWLGAWSGSCIAEFEVEPAAELRPWLAGLVIEKLDAPIWAKLRKLTEACPAGAGMVVRRSVVERWRELAAHDPTRQALGPGGKQPGAGDDADMALSGFDLGLGTGRLPGLELTHLIPARKLTLDYLEKLHEGFGYSWVVLEAIYQTDQFPGKIQAGALRIFLLQILMLVLGKGHAERSIRLAVERGRLQARRELAQRRHSGSKGNEAPSS